MTLYQIDQALLDLMEQSVDPETGELNLDEEEWERLSLERDVKIENTGLYIKDLQVRIAAFKAEIRELQRRQKVLERKEAWLMENLKRSLDGQNFETTRCTLKFKKNPETVLIEDKEAALAWAEKYAPDAVKHKEPDLLKSDLKTILKNTDMEIPGCRLVQETRLEVR